jgi:hypothetical protein
MVSLPDAVATTRLQILPTDISASCLKKTMIRRLLKQRTRSAI